MLFFLAFTRFCFFTLALFLLLALAFFCFFTSPFVFFFALAFIFFALTHLFFLAFTRFLFLAFARFLLFKLALFFLTFTFFSHPYRVFCILKRILTATHARGRLQIQLHAVQERLFIDDFERGRNVNCFKILTSRKRTFTDSYQPFGKCNLNYTTIRKRILRNNLNAIRYNNVKFLAVFQLLDDVFAV